MDREELKRRLVPFEELGQQRGLPFTILRYDDPPSGLERGQYALRIVAPWAAGKSFDEKMDPILDLLWESTDEETRGGISSILVEADEQALNSSWLLAAA